jgi:2-polyprenyl-3-methyl-5-hydroxy-6-metoxy-1,4-benzoquinol methylase
MPLVVDPDGVEPAAIRELVDVRGLRILEIGCGDGRMTFACAREGASVFAIDSDVEEIEEARASTPGDLADRVRFEAADAAQIELPRGEFDLALFSWSL